MINGKPNGNAGQTTAAIVEWPQPITEDGMYGIAGEYVRLVEPHTEGDRNIILLSFLCYAGNLLGRNVYVRTGADRHYPNLYLCPVGTTGTGRKGSGVAAAKAFFSEGNLAPGLPHLLNGISSGEGVMVQVRDPQMRRELNRKTGKIEEFIADPGVSDKRMLISLGEFQQYIAAMRRQDSILSSVLRQAWDTGTIASPSKNNEVKVNGAHISLIGCISKEELLIETTAVDAQNGTLNRFLFAASQRSRLLPEGGEFDSLIESSAWSDLQRQFNQNIAGITGTTERLERDSDTQDEWGRNTSPNQGLYKQLSQPRLGLWGSVTARAAQQVIRLSLISAKINGHTRIQGQDQAAAYEIWRYCDHSARYIFGDRLNDNLSSRIMTALRDVGEGGLTRNQIHEVVHRPSSEIQESLAWLAQTGIAYCHVKPTGGRPVETWFASL